MSSRFRLITESGYCFFEVASSLQKTIRRGLEEEAMFWATELETRFPDYLWKRLQIISIEDIGIANPQVVLYVAEMRRIYQELKKEYDKKKGKGHKPFRMALSNAILAMCRAKKSRVGDEFQIVIYGRRDSGWRLDIPDYALDMHTPKGKRMGRGQKHFWEEGVILKNEKKLINPYSEEAAKVSTSQPHTDSKPERKKLF
jgi:replication-associated recombination protein RarA